MDSVRLKAKGTIYVSAVFSLIKLFPIGIWVKDSNATVHDTGIGQLSRWMADDGSQFSHCWRRIL